MLTSSPLLLAADKGCPFIPSGSNAPYRVAQYQHHEGGECDENADSQAQGPPRVCALWTPMGDSDVHPYLESPSTLQKVS